MQYSEGRLSTGYNGMHPKVLPKPTGRHICPNGKRGNSAGRSNPKQWLFLFRLDKFYCAGHQNSLRWHEPPSPGRPSGWKGRVKAAAERLPPLSNPAKSNWRARLMEGVKVILRYSFVVQSCEGRARVCAHRWDKVEILEEGQQHGAMVNSFFVG